MKTVSVVEMKSHFSALLTEVESGEEISVTRRGKIVGRLVPETPHSAADAFRDFWQAEDIDLEAPPDPPAEPVVELDD